MSPAASNKKRSDVMQVTSEHDKFITMIPDDAPPDWVLRDIVSTHSVICPCCGNSIPLVTEVCVRTSEATSLIAKISKAIVEERYVFASGLVTDLIKLVGENDPEVIRAETLLSFLTEDLV